MTDLYCYLHSSTIISIGIGIVSVDILLEFWLGLHIIVNDLFFLLA